MFSPEFVPLVMAHKTLRARVSYTDGSTVDAITLRVPALPGQST